MSGAPRYILIGWAGKLLIHEQTYDLAMAIAGAAELKVHGGSGGVFRAPLEPYVQSLYERMLADGTFRPLFGVKTRGHPDYSPAMAAGYPFDSRETDPRKVDPTTGFPGTGPAEEYRKSRRW